MKNAGPHNACLVLIRLVGLDRFTTLALGPLSIGSKDYGTHNAFFFSSWNFIHFQSGENTVLLNLGCRKLKGLRELMRTLNATEGELR